MHKRRDGQNPVCLMHAVRFLVYDKKVVHEQNHDFLQLLVQ